MTLKEYLKNIADTIRSLLGGSVDYKINAQEFGDYISMAASYNREEGYNIGYAEGNQEGYDIGYAKGSADGSEEGFNNGYEEGYTLGKEEGVAEGKQAEYDVFWDAFQLNGYQNNYLYAFAGIVWRDTAYNPKYTIVPTVNFSSAYTYSYITDTKVPIDLSGLSINISNSFSHSQIKTIRELIVSENTPMHPTTFGEVYQLESLTMRGTLAQSIDLHWSYKLNKASIISVIGVLSDTAVGLTCSFSKTAVNNAFEGGSTGSEWLNLIATKSNWTISLV